MTQENGYDESPMTLEISGEEHALLMNALNHAADGMDLITGYSNVYTLPKESEIRQQYELMTKLRQRVNQMWVRRFTHQED